MLKWILISLLVMNTLFVASAQSELVCDSNIDYMTLGKSHLDNFRDEEAVQAFSCAIMLEPDNADAYFYRGIAYRDLSEFDNAIADFERLSELEPNGTASYGLLATVYRRQGSYEKCVEYSSIAIELVENGENTDENPPIDLDYLNRGRCYYYLEQYDTALENLDVSIELYTDTEIAYAIRGFIFYRIDDVENAEMNWDTAKEIDANAVDSDLREGNYLLEAENFRQATIVYTEATILAPNDYRGYYLRGLAHQLLGNDITAIQDFDRALEIRPDFVDVYNARGVSHFNLGELEKAKEDWQYFLDNSELISGYVNQGNLLLDSGEYELALTRFSTAIVLDPELPEAYLGLADTYYALEQYGLAAEAYATYLELETGEVAPRALERLQ